VLGCTHYPFLAPLIRRLAGASVQVLDPAPAVARELARRLAALELLNPTAEAGSEQFWTSADPRRIGPVISALWGAPVELSGLPLATPAA